MQRFKFLLLVVFMIGLIGCGQNRNEDNTDNENNETNNAENRIEAENQYKITFSNDGLSPDTIRMTSGICYQLDFENNSGSEMEFIAGKTPSDKGFDTNFFEGLSVENIINEKETEAKDDQPLTGIKLKPGEKGSLAFTPDDEKKGEWSMATRTGSGSGNQDGVIIVQ